MEILLGKCVRSRFLLKDVRSLPQFFARCSNFIPCIASRLGAGSRVLGKVRNSNEVVSLVFGNQTD